MTRDEQHAWNKLNDTGHGHKSMKEVVDQYQSYVKKYVAHSQTATDKILIDDMLYGLGTALDDKYTFRDGFLSFKKMLVESLLRDIAEDVEKPASTIAVNQVD